MLFDMVIPKDEKIKVIVTGSNSFTNHLMLKKELNQFMKEMGVKEIEVLSNTEHGARKLGEHYAKHYNYDFSYIEADWASYGKSADYKRDEGLAEIADACIVFWDNKDKVTLNMINIAKRYKLKLKIINYNKETQND